MTKMSAEERAKSIADAEPSGNETIRTMIHEEAWVQIRAAESIARAEGFKAGQEQMRLIMGNAVRRAILETPMPEDKS